MRLRLTPTCRQATLRSRLLPIWNTQTLRIPMSDDYDYEMEIFLDPDSSEDSTEAVKRMLQNLGYATGEPLEHQIQAFQRDHGLAVTGSLGDAADHVTQCHDQCKPPLRVLKDAS